MACSMSGEAAFISRLRGLARHPAARGLMDDAAVLELGGAILVFTHDMMVEGVHFLAHDPPADVAWKLVASNLSDLAAKGAAPMGLLLGYTLAEDSDWDEAFVAGLGAAVARWKAPLLGGDTVSVPAGAPRTLGLTAIGRAAGPVPARSGAKAGDELWVSGTIGDAGAGLAMALGKIEGSPALLQRHRRPEPRLEAGQKLAPIVSAMMDVSDGLLIDARRMAAASGVGLALELGRVPLSPELVAASGTPIEAATAGDDYELLLAAPPSAAAEIGRIGAEIGLAFTRIGAFRQGSGLALLDHGTAIPLPARLGWEHGRS